MSNIDEIIAGVGHKTYNRITFGAGHTSGNTGTTTLFTVSGLVEMRIFAHCEVALTGGSATIALGTTITAGGLITQATATDLVAGEIWHDATPDASVELATVSAAKLVSQDIKLTIATAAVTAGRIVFTCIWKPISNDAYVSARDGSASASPSPSASLSPSTSLSPSASTSVSPSASLSPSSSESRSPSASLSPSSSVSRSPSASVSSSISPSPSL